MNVPSRRNLLIVTICAVLVLAAVGIRLQRSERQSAPEPRISVAPEQIEAPSGGDPGRVASTRSSPDASAVVVDVEGMVRHPGIHRLPAGSRVSAAINAAGGFRGGADPVALNRAARLTDGQQIVVPARPQGVEARDGAVPAVTSPAAAGATTAAPVPPVSLNSASARELEELPGVGPALAAAIVDDRTKNGAFSSVDELDRVSGIGPAILARIRPVAQL